MGDEETKGNKQGKVHVYFLLQTDGKVLNYGHTADYIFLQSTERGGLHQEPLLASQTGKLRQE